METKIRIPNIGEDEVEVTEILVNIGDYININQPLLIIEGDKSSMEIPSPYSGIVNQFYIAVGDKVHTGSIILTINIKHNDENQNIVKNLQPTNQHNAYNHYFKQYNDIDKKIDTLDNAKQNKTHLYNQSTDTYATPFIRHTARTLGVDLSKITGSGRKGRILKEDIQKYLSTISKQDKDCLNSNSIPNQLSIMQPNSQNNYDKFGKIESIQLNKIKKISGFHLQKNWSTIPHVTQFDMVDITNLEQFRKQQNLEIIKQNKKYKITILVFVMKAVSKVLEQLPYFNSSLSKDGHTLILKKYINIGIAVDTNQGLLVPVLRNVNKKNIIQLTQELSNIAQKARAGNQLSPLDMKGGSFTISNLGGIGGIAFTPIINAAEVAILGISTAFIHPVWIKNKFLPRLMLPLSLSYDHRVIDGADGARFINLVNKIISDIRLLSM